MLCAVACYATTELVCVFVNPSGFFITGILVATEITAGDKPCSINRAVCSLSLHVLDTVGTANELPSGVLCLGIEIGDHTSSLTKEILSDIITVANQHLNVVSVAYTVNCHRNKPPCSNRTTGIHIKTLAVDATVTVQFRVKLIATFNGLYIYVETGFTESCTSCPKTGLAIVFQPHTAFNLIQIKVRTALSGSHTAGIRRLCCHGESAEEP